MELMESSGVAWSGMLGEGTLGPPVGDGTLLWSGVDKPGDSLRFRDPLELFREASLDV